MTWESLLQSIGLIVVIAPTSLAIMMCLTGLSNRHLPEQVISWMTQSTVVVSGIAALWMLAAMLATGIRYVPIELGDWVRIPEVHFHFHWKFVFDRLSVAFLLLSLTLCFVVSIFTKRYLHREKGYHRFFLLYSLFVMGITISAIAGTIETLFFGWELVGLSSALLVAYFHDRTGPVQNGQHVWTVYRLADAAFLLGALVLHHFTGEGDFNKIVGTGNWPDGVAKMDPSYAFQVGLLLLLAAAGKSALFPFSGWLPRAMEGPTPSSAVFYGALSVHLGAYLLLRVSPILEASLLLRGCVIGLGLVSAIFGAIIGSVQTDVKSSLAYASLTQVGLIVVEIGLGWYYLALIHMIGHASLRTLQLLRAPTLLTDYFALENAMGMRLPSTRKHAESQASIGLWKMWWFRFGFERGFMDVVLKRWIVSPVLGFFRWSDRQERRWVGWLSGEAEEQA
jgi:NADH:ubiquinone oxidoreductase subunit 5 (subunit L)/multisubunit Na+/H+ antiporter MnhA subunit